MSSSAFQREMTALLTQGRVAFGNLGFPCLTNRASEAPLTVHSASLGVFADKPCCGIRQFFLTLFASSVSGQSSGFRNFLLSTASAYVHDLYRQDAVHAHYPASIHEGR